MTDPKSLAGAPVRFAMRVSSALVTGIAVVSLLLLPGSAAQPISTGGASTDPMQTWLTTGGRQRIDAVVGGIAGLVQTANSNGKTGFTAMRGAATRLLDIVEDAETYAEPPGGQAVEAWHAGLLGTGTAARMVTVAIDTVDVALMERAIQILSDGYEQLLRLQRVV